MAQYEFVSERGGSLSEVDPDSGARTVWARFSHAPDLDTAEGARRYRCVTGDAAAAKRLRELAGRPDLGYELTEVTSPAATPARQRRK